ncbi:CTD-interacting factor [Psychroflexus sp. ALD_RP9]|uniref:CTD-interacting factor n=1 Tax=Psychroflexus sp. ALD_RP9 TaxID=2777186 RepID=UPI001A8C6B57|nr:CTD-interacting factor [Psychroflexus sp. ALD_RP9]QSS97409.1 CTD-interacting factor [Psychroflexus sp. ALD_RP9]
MVHVIKSKDLVCEYQNWKYSQTIIQAICETLKNKFDGAQLKAGLENSLINSLQANEAFDIYHTFKKLNIKNLIDGFKYTEIKPSKVEFESILDIIKITKKDARNTNEISISADDNSLKIEDFKLSRNQYVDKAINYVSKKYDLIKAYESTLIAALRYASIYAKTRHIGPPQDVYDLFFNWGIRNEGFASPFNARLLGKDDCKFYSLFKETDLIFGSEGSFFNQDKPKNPGHWSLDPPFTSEIIELTETKLEKWIKLYPDISFLLIIPASYQLKIKPSETIKLSKNIHSYEGLEGVKKKLPLDVNIHRFGEIEKFSVEAIKNAYT